MANLPDLGTYTQDETRQLAIDALTNLRLDQKVKAVLEAFSKEERGELLAWLDEADEGQ